MNEEFMSRLHSFIKEQINLAKDMDISYANYIIAQSLLVKDARKISEPDKKYLQKFFDLTPKAPKPQKPIFQIKDKQAPDNKQKQPTFSSAFDLDNNEPSQKSLKNQLTDAATDLENQKLQQPKLQPPQSQDPPQSNKYIAQLLADNIIQDTSNFTLNSISGMQSTKLLLQTSILLPLLRPSLFLNKNPYKKIFMHSLPGCGKSFITKCIAGEAKIPLISVTSSMIFSKWQGASEKMISAVFQLAKQQGRCILFLDEIDAFCTTRSEQDSESSRRVKNELLLQLDQLEASDVIVIAATNLPFQVDTAVRRRFEKRIYIDLPDAEARRDVLRKGMEKLKIENSEILNQCVELTPNYSMADLKNVVKDCENLPLQRLISCEFFAKIDGKWAPAARSEGVKMSILTSLEQFADPKSTPADMLESVTKTRSSVTLADQKLHVKFSSEFGSG
ncbi:Vacuolar protein sorting 4b [Spironucleus salmonicida]|uniref:Topoisomerase II n=1 Tax=Spironucleus salmonicida TaxID=348837 RepID=V6LLR9_9EUKA|nr:Vacuolar protein sorting 4b [Spironucleus salmonicida]|eukprot:EST45577.1 Topoisomerase II [Spironucleus salmonicida]